MQFIEFTFVLSVTINQNEGFTSPCIILAIVPFSAMASALYKATEYRVHCTY